MTVGSAVGTGPRIGVFDSGVGGLTVLQALLPRIAGAQYIYLGDTARLPYGSKSKATIERYAVSSARFLVEQGSEMLVIACNTASALALDAIRAAVTVPVLGVIEPGARQAHVDSTSGDVLVIATAATVESHAYSAACREQGLRTHEKACPLLVPLVEEGWTEHPVTTEIARIYLGELEAEAKAAGLKPDTLVLGCTHYPLLRGLIERTVSPGIRVIDSAEATAVQAAETYSNGRGSANRNRGEVSCRFFATDSVEKFRRLGSRFLGRAVDGVELVDLGG